MSSNTVVALLSNMPPGIRFQPTEDEIFSYYLRNKILGKFSEFNDIIAEVDFYKFDPWKLPSKSKIPSTDQVWWFFSLPDYKYSNSKRSNRQTETGSWKITGPERSMMGPNGCIGKKKILVFHTAAGKRTEWVMHEFSVKPDNAFPDQRAYVLCRLEKKKDEKGQKAETPDHEESELQSGEITSDVENPVAPAETPEVQGPESFSQPLDSPKCCGLKIPEYGSSIDEEMYSLLSSFAFDNNEMQASFGAYESDFADSLIVNPKENNYGETSDNLLNEDSLKRKSVLDGTISSQADYKEVNEQVKRHCPLSTGVALQ